MIKRRSKWVLFVKNIYRNMDDFLSLGVLLVFNLPIYPLQNLIDRIYFHRTRCLKLSSFVKLLISPELNTTISTYL